MKKTDSVGASKQTTTKKNTIAYHGKTASKPWSGYIRQVQYRPVILVPYYIT